VGDGGTPALPAVAVYAERAADGEVVVRLHDRHGMAAGVEIGDDVGPAGAGANVEDAGGGVELHVVEGEHVDDDAVRADGVSAHAVLRAGDRHRELAGTGAGEQLGELRLGLTALGGDLPDLGDARLVEPAGVIDKAVRRGLLVVAIAPPGVEDEV